MMQELTVAILVACAACFVIVRTVPKAVLGAAGRVLVRTARRAGWNAGASRLEKSLASAKHAGACGGCGGCESGKKPRMSGGSGMTVEALRRTAKR